MVKAGAVGAFACISKVIRVALVAAFVGVSIAPGANARGPVVASVDAVKIGTYDDFTRVVMHVNVPLSPKLFTLSDPNRLVIDLPRISWNMPRPNGVVRSRLIRDYTFGILTPRVSRLIFNLNGPAQIVDFKVTPLTDKVGYELDIRLAEAFRPFDRYRRIAEKTTRISDSVVVAKAAPKALPAAPVVDVQTREEFRNRRFDPETAQYDALGALFAGLAGTPVEKVAPPVVVPKPVAPPVQVVVEKKVAPKKSSPKVIAMVAKPPRPALALPKRTEVPKRKPKPKPKREPFRIVIDPGHGGRDPGAGTQIGEREASVVLAFSEELMKLLEADPEYAPFATRRSDRFVPLPKRVDYARDKNASLFISIHADWFNDPKVSGAGAYMLSEKDSIRSTEEFVSNQKDGTIAGIDIDQATDDVLRVLLDLERRETQIGSRRFAEMVRDKLSLVTPVKRKFVRHKKLHVLKAPDMPSVLLELGFMSNPEDRKRLSSEEWRKEAAGALKEAIDAWRRERGLREAMLR